MVGQDKADKTTGARFFKCALQVNSFDYLQRHGKPASFSDETSYNEGIVDACLQHGVEAIAVADHYRIKGATSLIGAALDAGIKVFPGFEAVSKDGVHFLCILDPSSSTDLVQSKIAACGIHDDFHRPETLTPASFWTHATAGESNAWQPMSHPMVDYFDT